MGFGGSVRGGMSRWRWKGADADQEMNGSLLPLNFIFRNISCQECRRGSPRPCPPAAPSPSPVWEPVQLCLGPSPGRADYKAEKRSNNTTPPPSFPPPRKECLFACLANHLCGGLSFLTCFLVIVHIACQHDNTFSKSSSLAPKHKLSFLIFVGHLSPPGHSLFYITVDRNTILFCAFSPPLGINVSSCCYIVCVIIILWLYNCIEF